MFAIGIGSLLFIVQMRLDKTGEKEKAVGKSECFVFVGHRDKSSRGGRRPSAGGEEGPGCHSAGRCVKLLW